MDEPAPLTFADVLLRLALFLGAWYGVYHALWQLYIHPGGMYW